jgi:hypothetical protein
MRRVGLPLVALAVLGQGCVAHVKLRASSAAFVPIDQATAHFTQPPPEVYAALQPEMVSRGYLMVQQVEGSPGAQFYLFKGVRKPMPAQVHSELKQPPAYELGSWFAVKVALGDKGLGTDVTMMGKPTVNGQEVCSDADKLLAEAHYWCQDTEVQADYQEMKQVAGREEADLVKGALAALATKLPAAAPTSAPAAAPEAPAPEAPMPPPPPPPLDLSKPPAHSP